MTEGQFWAMVEIGGVDQCWNWTGKANQSHLGYGRIRWNGRRELSNRLSFQFSRGRKPSKWALHTCDNPRCCNPWHIYDGTPADNVRDCVSRSRHRVPKGEDNHLAKLSADEVNQIRLTPKRYGSGLDLAKRFDVDPQTISNIRSNRTWRHI